MSPHKRTAIKVLSCEKNGKPIIDGRITNFILAKHLTTCQVKNIKKCLLSLARGSTLVFRPSG